MRNDTDRDLKPTSAAVDNPEASTRPALPTPAIAPLSEVSATDPTERRAMQTMTFLAADRPGTATPSSADDGLDAFRAVATQFDAGLPAQNATVRPSANEASQRRRAMRPVRMVCWIAAAVAVLQVHGTFQAAAPVHDAHGPVAATPR